METAIEIGGSINDQTSRYLTREPRYAPYMQTMAEDYPADVQPWQYPEVKLGQFKISTKPLYTAGLGSCSALALYDGKKFFLAHIDASCCPDLIAEVIKEKFDLTGIEPSAKIVIFTGELYAQRTFSIACEALDQLGLLSQAKLAYGCSLFHEVGLAAWGSFSHFPTGNGEF